MYKRFTDYDWSKKSLWQLKNEIVLNSMNTTDYRNSFKIDPLIVQNFFDGYMDFIYLLMLDDGYTDKDTYPTIWRYDTIDNLLKYTTEVFGL